MTAISHELSRGSERSFRPLFREMWYLPGKARLKPYCRRCVLFTLSKTQHKCSSALSSSGALVHGIQYSHESYHGVRNNISISRRMNDMTETHALSWNEDSCVIG